MDVKIRYLGSTRLKLGPGGSELGCGDAIIVENSVAESLRLSSSWEIVKGQKHWDYSKKTDK